MKLRHKQMHISNSFHILYKPFLKSVHKTNPCRNLLLFPDTRKQQTQICEELVPSVFPLLKEHIWLVHAGIIHHSVYQDQIKEKF